MYKLVLFFCLGVVFAANEGPCTRKNADLKKLEDDALASGNPIMDMPSYNCEEDGSFARVQCIGSEDYCYCSTKDGKPIEDYHNNFHGGNLGMTCNCAREKHEYMQTGLIGKLFFCNETGNYKKVQCNGSVCFCADENGNNASNGGVNVGDIAKLNC